MTATRALVVCTRTRLRTPIPSRGGSFKTCSIPSRARWWRRFPGRTQTELWWAYEFMLGAMVYVMGDAGRLARLTGSLCRPDDENASVRHMVAFLTAGIRFGAPAAESKEADNPTKTTRGKTHATRDLSKG